MLIEFKCKCCGSISNEKFRVFVDYPIGAYANVEWSEENSKIPQIEDGTKWQRSEKRPKLLEERVIRVGKPFSEETGHSFWCLYQSALSYFNGWDEHPEEIDHLAFLNCKLIEVLEKTEYHAWLKIEVVKSLPLSDSPQKYPIVKEALPITNEVYAFDHFEVFKYDAWEYYRGGAQGDLGNWFLVKSSELGQILIAFGEWNFHEDFAYYGNVLASEKTINTLKQWVATSA